MIKLLKFTFGNSKLKNGECIFSLPAGFSCPFAKTCKSCSNRKTGKITDGKNTEIRCYAASFECYRPNVREAHWHNFDLLKRLTTPEMITLIENSFPDAVGRCRLGGSGDFFSQDYFDAWLSVAANHPDVLFYAYTKSLPYWVSRLEVIPKNFKLVASWGGVCDDLIPFYGLKSVRVVFSVEEAKQRGLPLDFDDSYAWQDKGDFAHLIHATQPKGTEAAKAWYKLKGTKHGGYSRNS